MKTRGTLVIALLLLAAAAPALLGSQFHVTTNGTSGGNGSSAQPWNLQTALNQPSSLHAGDTVWVHGGTYAGTFGAKLNGTSASPIIVRNYNGERVTIDGGNSNGAPILTIDATYTWFWGLEIMSSTTNKISTQATSWPTDIMYGEGVMIAQGGSGGTGCKFINLVIHDTRQGVSSWKEAMNSEVYGCVVYDNGWVGSDRAHGHNMYIQDVSGRKVFQDNIILRAYSHNVQSYGSSAANEDYETFDGNVISMGGERNFMLGGDNPAQDPVFTNNMIYVDGPCAGMSTLYMAYPIGYPSGTNNALVQGNYIAGGNLTWNANTNMTLSGNTFYYTAMNGDVPNMSGNTATTSKPGTNAVFVRVNKYEPSRANITVFNWTDQASVPVNVSSVLRSGDTYIVRDAQNYYGPVVASGTYGGGSITLPMTGGTLPSKVGNDPRSTAHTTMEFGTFVLIGSGSGGQNVSGSLSASPPSLPAGGGTVTLTWSSVNATSASLNQGIGTVPANGSRTVQVTATTTFTLTLNGTGGPVTSSATVQVAPPPVVSAPELLAPACGLANASTPVTLSWNPVSGATSYEVSVATDSLFAAPVDANTSVGGTSQQVSGLASATEYYWRVRGKNSSGAGSYSAAWWFTTAAGQSPSGLPLSLLGTPPEEGTIAFNVQKTESAQTANITMSVFDADGASEGMLYINGRDSIPLFGSIANPSRDNNVTVFTIATPAADWNNGANLLRFTHAQTGGYRVDSITVSFGAPLPIQLSTFAAAIMAPGSVTLSWTTLSETNNYGFYVQKGSSPGSAFVRISGSFVAGHGTTVVEHRYTYTDDAHAQADSYYRLEQMDLDGSTHYSDPVKAQGLTGVETGALPLSFALLQNYPNPFNPSTAISYQLSVGSQVSLTVHDLLGRQIAVLASGYQQPGAYSVRFDASKLASGVYVARLVAGDRVGQIKLLLLK